MLGLRDAGLSSKCAICECDHCPQYLHMERQKTYTGATAFDLKCGFNHLFFYGVVMSWRAVGDVQAALLAVLPNQTEETFGSIVTRRFHNMRYIKVDKNDTINPNIRDDMDGSSYPISRM